jgi:pyruvate dehydrogenase E1 component alpha subunit
VFRGRSFRADLKTAPLLPGWMAARAPVVPLPYTLEQAAEALGPSWKTTVLDAYRWMVGARTLDARMLALQRQGRVGFYGAATGQEAVNVAAGLASARDDWVLPGLREQLVALVRGHPLGTYVHHLFADAADPALGRNMPCHPTAREVNYVSMSSVIGTQVTHAVGVAYGMRRRRANAAALAFFGDGATSSNDFHAGMNLAGVWGLPVLFACTNNQWAISVPVERQTASATLAAKAGAYGLQGARLDGTDFVACWAAIASALGRLRAGGPPEMLEFLLYRMTAHSSSDDPSRYQPSDWAERARTYDPLSRLEAWLVAQRLLDPPRRAALQAEAEEAVRAAVRAAETTAAPEPRTLTEDVFARGRSGATALQAPR